MLNLLTGCFAVREFAVLGEGATNVLIVRIEGHEAILAGFECVHALIELHEPIFMMDSYIMNIFITRESS